MSPFPGPEERERVWGTYSGLEQELGTLRETLEYLLHLGSPQVPPCPEPGSPALDSKFTRKPFWYLSPSHRTKPLLLYHKLLTHPFLSF